eukprot:8221924-Pyramimonas_sp.AAC.1
MPSLHSSRVSPCMIGRRLRLSGTLNSPTLNPVSWCSSVKTTLMLRKADSLSILSQIHTWFSSGSSAMNCKSTFLRIALGAWAAANLVRGDPGG